MRLEGLVHGTSHPEALIKFVARVSLPCGKILIVSMTASETMVSKRRRDDRTTMVL
jgi:hypothetical protein